MSLLAALPFLAAVLAWGPRIAAFYAGARFAPAAEVMSWLALASVIQIAAPTLSSALLAQGRAVSAMAANILSSLALYPLLPLLLNGLALRGAGLQAVIQAAAAMTLLTLFTTRAGLREHFARSAAGA